MFFEDAEEKDFAAYYYLLLTRRFEETLNMLYHSGRLRGHPHSSIGQEAVGVGAVMALEPQDSICPSLRCVGSMITKGISVKTLLCEAYRKGNSSSGGRWLYHHISEPEKGVIIGSAVVAGSIPVAVGVSLANHLKRSNTVTLSFFGDGATSRGDFHEALNFASVFQLPIVFICENNLYALSTPHARQMNIENIADRAAGYGIPGYIADGSDVYSVNESVAIGVKNAREGNGPSLVECKTYRLRAHSEIDQEAMGRSDEEMEYWREKANPIEHCRKYISEKYGHKSQERLRKIECDIENELKEAVDFAQASPEPLPTSAISCVYAE